VRFETAKSQEYSMQTLKLNLKIVGLISCVALAACGGSQAAGEPAASPLPPAEPAEEPMAPAETPAETPAAEAATAAEPAAPKTVEVALQAKSGSKLAGKVTLTEVPEGVKVVLSVENVSPGDHGAHIHEKGDCSAADGASAGGHYNPGSHPHALPTGTPRHLGDLGNINVGKDGKGTLEIVATGANLKDGDQNSFLGRAVIVHEKKDDGGQPTGNAGGRIGCAEIK
jgi:Cu-Zn family superoxide dismutase